MGLNQADDSLSRELAKLEEWPLSEIENREGHVQSQAPGDFQEDPFEGVYSHSRSSTPHIDTAEIGRVLSPGHRPGSYARSRRGPPSVAHSLVSPSISESGEGEDPSSVSSDCFQSLSIKV
jgi:hypothetical protein